MKLLLERLGVSITHLICLDQVFRDNHEEYRRIENKLMSAEYRPVYEEIARELYAGGKKLRGNIKLSRQMILGDLIEYIFTGRAYYYAAKSEKNLNNFLKLILYTVNKLLIFDIITVNPTIRKQYIQKLEAEIDNNILYEKDGDERIAKDLRKSNSVIWGQGWNKDIDSFVDSILPKTLGCPKELIVFSELIRTKKGIVIPLLLIQRMFGGKNSIAPPDFLIIKNNKEIFGIEVGYEKEGQSREFSIPTSIPTFAVDLKNNMHNRCPRCGENILYCDPVINAYTEGTLMQEVETRGGKFYCNTCPLFLQGHCKFSNYYGKAIGKAFNNSPLESSKDRHYHAICVNELHY